MSQVAAVVVQDEVYVVNVGDSRAVLVRRTEGDAPSAGAVGIDDTSGAPGTSRKHRFPWEHGVEKPPPARYGRGVERSRHDVRFSGARPSQTKGSGSA